MNPHPRYQYKPEDLFLTVFVYVDDWLKPYQKLLPRLGSAPGETLVLVEVSRGPEGI